MSGVDQVAARFAVLALAAVRRGLRWWRRWRRMAVVAAAAARCRRRAAGSPARSCRPRASPGSCVNPRSGTNPADGRAVHRDSAARRPTRTTGCARGATISISGTTRSSIAIPGLHTTPEYFNLLKTPAITASGAPKDRFHFTYRHDGVARASRSRARRPVTAPCGRSSRACRRGGSSSPTRSRVRRRRPANSAARRGSRARRRRRRRQLEHAGDIDIFVAGLFPDAARRKRTRSRCAIRRRASSGP